MDARLKSRSAAVSRPHGLLVHHQCAIVWGWQRRRVAAPTSIENNSPQDLPILRRQVERAVDRPAASTREGIPMSDMKRREFITLRSDAADPAWGWMSLSWLAVVIGCLYILSARLSLALLTPDGVAVFWPAAGVAAGALIAFGPRARWAVVAGTMVATIVAN